MAKRIFTDFDGPIMDVSERYYQVYLYCVETISAPQQAINILPKSEFWELKRSQVSEQQIAKMSGFDDEQSIAFANLRRATVHSNPYFKYDRIIDSAVTALETAQQSGIELAVMTMRRHRELGLVLDQYNLRRFFPEDRIFCLSNDYLKTVDIEDKPLLMQSAQANLPQVEQQWMIGDTEADITAAQRFNIPAIAVLSGIRNQTQLEKYHPIQIFPNLLAAINGIKSFEVI
ncbi:MAG: haloacid dehalogenase [Oscillatoriales cyanobacterium CG2_30_44_21]|nr:MAG: haloacid dehalogenase [Oscillatoriales cyanobacterium CG2_30_44_21]